MARHHEDWLKYGLYAVGAYLAYTKVWPLVSGEINSLTSRIPINPVSSLANYGSSVSNGWGQVQTVLGNGIPSSSLAVNTPVNRPLTPNASLNTNTSIARYYITAQDRVNMLALQPNSNPATNTYSFDTWKSVYWQAKGFALPLLASDVDIADTSQLISLDQFLLLVNTHFPNPTLNGLGHIGLAVDNRWFGVI